MPEPHGGDEAAGAGNTPTIMAGATATAAEAPQQMAVMMNQLMNLNM